MPKRQVLGMGIIIVILSFICMYIYDNFKVEVKTTVVVNYSEKDELVEYYQDRDNNSYYLLGLDSIIIDYTDRKLDLDRALNTKQIDMDFIFENLKEKYSINNDKVKFYQNNDFSLLECVKDDGTKNYVFGKDVMNYKEGLCKPEPYLCSFSKKYYIMDITDSNDLKNRYLTLKSTTNGEVDTVKMDSSDLDNIYIGQYYTFEFASLNNDVDGSIKEVFSNNSIINIELDEDTKKINEDECK